MTKKLLKRVAKKRWEFLKQDTDGILHVQGVSVKDIAKKYGTPLYIMDEEKIRQRVRNFVTSFTYPNLRVQYACKVNSNLEILRIMREEGLELDASSVGEIILGLLADFRPDQITFTNLYKTEQDIYFAARIGVQAITADSLEELDKIISVGNRIKQTIKVFLRFNPLIELGKYSTKNQQYGITADEAKKAISKAVKSEYVELVGLHFHGSYIFNPQVYKIAAKFLQKLAKYAKEKGAQIKYIDLGGGFPSEEMKGYFDTQDMGKDLSNYIVNLFTKSNMPLPILIFEPGKSLVMNSGMGLMEVISKKWHQRKTTLITNGSTYGFVPDIMAYKENKDILPATKMNKRRNERVRITGCTCDEIDVIDKNTWMPKMESGDILMIMDIGAYNQVIASNFNNLRRASMILVKEDGTTKLIRRRDRYSEMFAPELDVLKVADPKELAELYKIFRVNLDKVWRGNTNGKENGKKGKKHKS